MRKVFKALIILICILLLCLSCTPEPSVPENNTKWCYMFYLCSSNLTDYALQNLNEIAAVSPSDSTKVFIMTGGTKTGQEVLTQFREKTLPDLIQAMGTQNFEGSIGADNYQYWEYVYDKAQNHGVLKEIKNFSKGMSDPNVLKQFINGCYSRVENKNTCKFVLDLWGHSAGSLYGMINDLNYSSDLMSLSEFVSAVQNSDMANDHVKFESVIFNTCLMQSYEMAAILAPYSKYMIGSEENSSALGPDYKSFTKYMYDNPDGNGEDFGRVFCQTALLKVKDLPDIYSTATWSNADLSKFSQLESAFTRLIECVDNATAIAKFNMTFMNNANIQFFVNTGFSSEPTGMFDLSYLAELMGIMYPDCATEAANLKSAIDNIITTNCVGTKINEQKHPRGLSVFFDSWCMPKLISGTFYLGSMVKSNYFEDYRTAVNQTYVDFLNNLSEVVHFVPNFNTWNELSQYIDKTSVTSIVFRKTNTDLEAPVVCSKNAEGNSLLFISKDTIFANVYINSMFESFPNLTYLDLSNFDTSYALDMSRMFYGCSNLTEILADSTKWIISQDTNTTDMFTGCGTDHVTFIDQ